MPRYILECPRCAARFNLRRHAPGWRIRCRRCRAVMIVPEAPGRVLNIEGPGARPLPPDVRARLVKALSLKRLAALSLLLAAALAGLTAAIVRKGEGREGPRPGPAPAERLTLDRLAAINRLLAIPLGRGFAWEYALASGGTEVRRVIYLSRGLDDEPLAEVTIVGPSGPWRQTLRASADGVYLVSEFRGDARWAYSTPIRLVPHPMYLEDAWGFRGSRIREGGASEDCVLEFRVAPRAEAVNSGVGRQTCFRVEVSGSLGAAKVEETLWYAKGVGLVKRRGLAGGRVDEALLMNFIRD